MNAPMACLAYPTLTLTLTPLWRHDCVLSAQANARAPSSLVQCNAMHCVLHVICTSSFVLHTNFFSGQHPHELVVSI